MRRTISTRMLIAGLVMMLALAAAIPALGTSVGPFSSEGCSVYGNTWSPSGGSSMRSTTSAFADGGGACNWSYLSASYWQAGQYNPFGPAWIQSGQADTGTQWNVNDAIAVHSACNPGGPCGSAVYQNTYD